MNRTAQLLLLFSIAFAFAGGCVDVEQEYFVNSDGTGKFICKVEVPVESDIYSVASNYGMSPAELMAKRIEDYRNQYRGIDVWRDVSYDFSEDKKTFIYKATGYFRDLNECFFCVPEIGMNVRCSFGYTYLGEIEMVLQTAEDEDLMDSPLPAISLSGKERTESMIEARIAYAKKKLAMPSYVTELKLKQIFNLPSDIKEFINFKPESKRRAELVFEGGKILKAMDWLMTNDRWLGDNMRYSTDPFFAGWDSWMNQRVFGSLGPVRLLMGSDAKDLFDYWDDSEVKQPEFVETVPAERSDGLSFDSDRYYQVPIGRVDKSKSANAQIRQAMELDVSGDYENAIREFANLIADTDLEDKYLARAHYQFGMCLFDNGFTKQAISEFDYVIDNYPFERVAAIKAANKRRAILNGTAIPRYVLEAMKIVPKPMVVSSYPPLYEEGVPADTNIVSITFDMPMVGSRWVYSSFDDTVFPDIGDGAVSFDGSLMTWYLPVKLESGKIYGILLNSPDAGSKKQIRSSIGFIADNGMVADPFVLVFTTMHDSNTPIFLDQSLLTRCEMINEKHVKETDSFK